MAGPRATRLQVGSAPWVAEERSSALQIAHDEVEEFSYSARNDFDWLNEHMADIFSENQINVAEIFKTPGKLRGKTPRTARKANPGEARVPLSNIFSATPKGAPNPFVLSKAERNHTPKVKIAADPQPAPQPSPSANVVQSVVDSGYHGSQSQDVMDVDYNDAESAFEEEATQPFSIAVDEQSDHEEPEPSSPAKEQQQSPTQHHSERADESVVDEMDIHYSIGQDVNTTSPPAKATHHHESTTPAGSPIQTQEEEVGEEEENEQVEGQEQEGPAQTSPVASSPDKAVLPSAEEPAPAEEDQPDVADEDMDDAPPSDGSSPIRPIVRKSSLNFASLPAREPITHKSTGNRISRTSHLDQTRTSYYNRPTGGKSLGNARHEATDDENDTDLDEHDEDEVDEVTVTKPVDTDDATAHNKTYTQRLQDQISKLGQLQPQTSRSSKSIASAVPAIQPSLPAAVTPAPQPTPKQKIPSPKPTQRQDEAGMEDDDEDEWIKPLGTPDNASNMFSPRPEMPKSYSADVMEGVSGKGTIGAADFVFPKTRQPSPQKPTSLQRAATTYSHQKSSSVPVFPRMDHVEDDGGELKTTISVSNPSLATVSESEADMPGSPKSPLRTQRDSPLKHVKNKLSSILGRSKGLLASSAASSAEGKASLLSPSTPRLGFHAGPSTMSIDQHNGRDAQPLYPDLSKHVSAASSAAPPASPTRTEGRKTRASIERDKAEEKRKQKEAKESKRQADQMDKLEKERAKEREKARVFSKEQERIAAMEKQVAAQKEKEKKVPAPPPTPTQATRTSPRRPKDQADDEDDIDMLDAPTTTTNMPPPPSVSRPLAPPPSATKGREIKRPIRPTRELAGKTAQPRTMIRVNLGSQHPQFHPSSSTATPNANEPSISSGSQSQLKLKQSQSSLHSKSSTQNLNSSISSSGRPKALEMAERKKERDEREAQRKQEAKLELERKKAATQEEKKRQEQQKRLEAERQKDEERKQASAQAEAKKNAQRQAMLEKAKQTRAPPPAARSVNGQPEFKSLGQTEPNRPPSRMASHRSQEELGRSVLQNPAKPAPKRTLQQDSKEAKRMRMTSEFDDLEMESQPSLQGPPVRPSNGLKKVTAATMLPQSQKPSKPRELPAKSMFPAGYANIPQGGANRDLYKTSVTGQPVQSKTAHPLDMAQVSKGAIPFASNPNPAGPSSHKTPARPMGVMGAKSVAKSATRSSPRFQNGDEIELQEIDTDEDDSDNEDRKEIFASWTDSPALREALAGQEKVDPMTIFGAPAPLNMEAVFSKSKERFHKFRARTSSANWSGPDGLTEEEIRKDLAAREKLRRDGAWSYDMGKELV
ncbi:uncharacterized protein PG998_003449 [Apiospora kogelbergensis]|uniref:uncharacterized protein n=1 Tax=Apiospora kogelbergensis TaxID=1337665 RepID=UPI00312F1CF2